MTSTVSHYDILGVSPDCTFKELKKAYFSKAKQCHPDLFGGDKTKEAEFKVLVHAFDILSDPLKRQAYDSIRSDTPDAYKFEPGGYSIMDSPADDTLEEIIVGNTIPATATMSTLFLDLEKTEVFMTFREGKNYYYQRKMGQAMALFRRACNHTPGNILYRYFLARTCFASGRYREAIKHYKHAIAVGKNRVPVQRLERIHTELEAVRKKKHPWWYGITAILAKEEDTRLFIEPEKEMVNEANRAIAGILKNQAKQERKRLNK